MAPALLRRQARKRPVLIVALVAALGLVRMPAAPIPAEATNDQTELVELTASDAASADRFGIPAVDGDAIMVGAFWDDDNGENSGSAYMFDSAGNELFKLTASDGVEGDDFGQAVAIDGDTIVVGAPAVGSSFDRDDAYVFDREGNEVTKLTVDDPTEVHFGSSVAVDGDTIVVGDPLDDELGRDSGAAYVFDTAGNRVARLTTPVQDAFGQSVAVDGDTIVVGAFGDDDNGQDAGSAYLFDTAGNQLAKLTADDGAAFDNFGFSVDVDDGIIVVGAHGHGNGLPDDDNGAAYVFDIAGNQLAKLTASDGGGLDDFGLQVAIDGPSIVVGAPNHEELVGAAYVFDIAGNELAKLTASDGDPQDQFGWPVAIGGDTAVVGAFQHDHDDVDSGAAYVFDLSVLQPAGCDIDEASRTLTVHVTPGVTDIAPSDGMVTVNGEPCAALDGIDEIIVVGTDEGRESVRLHSGLEPGFTPEPTGVSEIEVSVDLNAPVDGDVLTLRGTAGNDRIDGADGRDTARYRLADGPVAVDLAAGRASGADGHDRLLRVENVLGSTHDDTLRGDDGRNTLNGLDGDDIIEGADDDDVLIGGAGCATHSTARTVTCMPTCDSRRPIPSPARSRSPTSRACRGQRSTTRSLATTATTCCWAGKATMCWWVSAATTASTEPRARMS